MALPNAYAMYNNNKVLTASPAELTLMLYDGAIKFSNIAIIGIEQNDIEKTHKNIRKVEKIIEEFRSTLDRKYAVAEDFDRVYVYLLERLLEANIKKDKEILEEVNVHLRSMRDTWKEVMRLNKERHKA
ncbi:MAG: flagellar export chaperone FliS [Lachnospiraceae bacterium]|nr:flagellar export chaperone FliS [Lachnospiraceae bacterium]